MKAVAASFPPPLPLPRKGGGTFRHVAIIDVGKTNAKVSLVGAADAAVLAFRTPRQRDA